MRIGIEIGGTKLQIVTGDNNGQIIHRHRFAVDKERGATGILETIEETLRQVAETPTAIGVGFGGPVDWRTGRIATSHQVPGWGGFNLAEWLRERTNVDNIRIENDANVAALGEAVRGVASSFNQVFYVTLGSGVGGGMVVDGKIYHGAIPGEAEIGHLWLVPPDASGNPGQTIEQTCSGWAVDRQIRELLPQLDADSPLKRLVGNTVGGEARSLHPAYEQSDPVARMLIEQIGSVLAFGLSHVVHLFHPQAIVLGGGLSLIGEPLRAAVRTALPRFVMSAFHPAPIVLLAKLGEDAVPVGALLL
ncbi:ROK family glucokinase [Nibrella saemangeumensis]|uniref:ROK family glucokinase n=1 Tax=Nibrella saemangeumensis TaxID=1084526 RepID=A0ABP8NBW8_9BACT